MVLTILSASHLISVPSYCFLSQANDQSEEKRRPRPPLYSIMNKVRCTLFDRGYSIIPKLLEWKINDMINEALTDRSRGALTNQPDPRKIADHPKVEKKCSVSPVFPLNQKFPPSVPTAGVAKREPLIKRPRQGQLNKLSSVSFFQSWEVSYIQS